MDTTDRPIALTSRLIGKTAEGLPVDSYPNKFLPYTCDEIVAGQGGGPLWCDQIPRPTKKRRHEADARKELKNFDQR